MRTKCIRTFALSLLLGLIFSASQSTYADALSISELTFSNLQITPTTGSVQITSPWLVMTFAEARNSLGDVVDMGGAARSDAAATFASGHGFVSASGLLIECSTDVNIPGCSPREASSIGRGDLFNSFKITGGTGAVDVNVSAMLDGLQHVRTDSCGELARSEVIFSLDIADQFGNVVFSVFFQSLLTIGRNSEMQRLIAETVGNTAHLQFDTPYTILIEADTESRGITSPVPEPSTLVLMLSGLGLVRGFLRKKGRSPDE